MAPSSHNSAASVKVTEPVILIRINRLYRPEMTADELYDATRSSWKVGTRRDGGTAHSRYARAWCVKCTQSKPGIRAEPRRARLRYTPIHDMQGVGSLPAA